MTPTDLADLMDACPDCAHRNLTFPSTVTRTWRGARCAYVCSAGHEWTCAWADPAWATASGK